MIINSILIITIMSVVATAFVFFINKMTSLPLSFAGTFNIICYAATPFLLGQLPLSTIQSKSNTLASVIFYLAAFISIVLVYAGCRNIKREFYTRKDDNNEQQ